MCVASGDTHAPGGKCVKMPAMSVPLVVNTGVLFYFYIVYRNTLYDFK